MSRICLDAGVLGIYFSVTCTTKVFALFNGIKSEKIEAHVLKPVFCEAFFNICKLNGREKANKDIIYLKKSFPILQVDLDESLIVFSGFLKCQHRNALSYIDCMSLSYSINYKLEFHTTEKNLKKILPDIKKKLKIITYQFK
ncbi:MAG TPA: hypothetical protein VKM55_15295 [Candidatus Lokiarchaeia archaeon]|nr:hypothetical protein [Candidatus Lokiarchaeia archaeon]